MIIISVNISVIGVSSQNESSARWIHKTSKKSNLTLFIFSLWLISALSCCFKVKVNCYFYAKNLHFILQDIKVINS